MYYIFTVLVDINFIPFCSLWFQFSLYHINLNGMSKGWGSSGHATINRAYVLNLNRIQTQWWAFDDKNTLLIPEISFYLNTSHISNIWSVIFKVILCTLHKFELNFFRTEIVVNFLTNNKFASNRGHHFGVNV